jgi:sensor histidine kinase YesM
MAIAKVHDTIPIRNFLKLLIGFAILIQLSVTTYSHLNGYYEISGVDNYLYRFSRGTFLSLIGLLLVAYPDLYIIRKLDKSYKLSEHPVLRIINQFTLTVLVAVAAAVVITMVSHLISYYQENLFSVMLINALIFSVCNILLMVIFEAWIFFIESTESKRVTEDLERELSQIRFEVLKNQINPHFLFNSLNVLSGLVAKDSEKAQKFIGEFSHIYRYVLETIEQPLVTLGEEIKFARSYVYLQQIRYGKSLLFDVHLPASCLETYLPPLSLQLVLENVIKHNLVSSEQPLHIDISVEGESLIIKNNIQLKFSSNERSGLGQKNLAKRYAMVTKKIPQFRVETDKYRVILPLITEDRYGRTDH